MGEPVQPGTVLRIPEEHYLYGLGELVLRVTWADDVGVRWLDEQVWLRVRGVPLHWGGVEGPPREVLVRVAALPHLRRNPPQPGGASGAVNVQGD